MDRIHHRIIFFEAQQASVDAKGTDTDIEQYKKLLELAVTGLTNIGGEEGQFYKDMLARLALDQRSNELCRQSTSESEAEESQRAPHRLSQKEEKEKQKASRKARRRALRQVVWLQRSKIRKHAEKSFSRKPTHRQLVAQSPSGNNDKDSPVNNVSHVSSAGIAAIGSVLHQIEQSRGQRTRERVITWGDFEPRHRADTLGSAASESSNRRRRALFLWERGALKRQWRR